MAHNPGRTEQVRNFFAHVPHVEEKSMFGSIAFLVNGKICVSVGDHQDHIMMIRVGPDRYEESLRRVGARPAIMRSRSMKGYIFLTDEAILSPHDLESWIGLALDFNKTLV